METLFIIACFIVLFYLLIEILSIISLLFFCKQYPLIKDHEPSVSILLAARNEEQAILRCLQSLAAIDYPPGKIEILIGNDQSDDRTAEIVDQFISGRPEFRMLHIRGTLGKARGKANVLAHLAREAKGEFLLITDADIRVRPGWVRNMLGSFSEGTGTVSGITIMEGNSFFARMQRLEWTYYMGMIKAVAAAGIPATGVGNNMAVRKSAYDSVGGYETIDFSITEDHKLFDEIRKKGWEWKQLMQPESLNISLAVEDMDTFLRQRRRWMGGAEDLAFYWWLIFGLFALFYPALIVMMVINFKLALCLWLAKFALQNILLSIQFAKLKEDFRKADSLMYEFYCIFNAFVTPAIYIIRRRISWKGRKY